MKRLSILTIALMVVGSFVLSSCRGAVYTAPLVPRFTAAPSAVTVTFYTNAAVTGYKASGTVDITDALGDAGFTANVASATLYTLRTNIGQTEVSSTINNDPNGSSYYKTVKSTDAKAATKYTLTYASILNTANYATFVLSTNSANLSYTKAIYSLNINVENGNNGYTLDDYSKLQTTFASAIGNTP